MISGQCGVKLPKAFQEKIFGVESDKNLQTFNQLVSRSLTGDIRHETSSIAQDVVRHTSSNMSSSESLNILHGTSLGTPQKEYATLYPLIQKDSGVCNEYIVPDDLPLDLRVKLASCLIYCGEINEIEVHSLMVIFNLPF